MLARDREPGEVLRGHVATPEPNRRWATDLMTTSTKRDGVVGITLVVDCDCRSLLGVAIARCQERPTVLGALRSALEETFGSPANVPDGLELRSDHRPQFIGEDCRARCEQWHLEQTYAPVGCRTENAVVERLIRTLEEKVIWLRDWESADELHEAVKAWVKRYNETRPHQALGWKTRAEYRAEKLGCSTSERIAA